MHDFRRPPFAGLLQCRAERRHHLRLQAFVHQDVRAPGRARQILVRCGVAADDDRAPRVVETVGDGRRHRVVVHQSRADLEPIRLEDGESLKIGELRCMAVGTPSLRPSPRAAEK